MTYSNYTALDFAMDEHFQRWVLTCDIEVAHYWQTWLELHPEKKEEVEEARLLLRMQNFKQDPWSPERMLTVQERIRKSLVKEKSTSVHIPKKRKKNRRLLSGWMAVAASVTFLLGAAFSFYFFASQEQVFSTSYAETRQINLPDGSEVTLNANSELRFAEDWQKKEQRQVWLDGEAFFKVSKIISSKDKRAVKFVVHLEDIDVEVVGTSFNVNHRSGKIEVTLDEGIVDLKMTGGERLRMEPGDMVAYSAKTQRLDKLNVNTEKITAWRNHQMLLDEQPLSELAQLIKDYYGVEVRFSSKELADRKIKATLPTDNLELVLETLELMLDVQSERKGNQIIMK